MAGIVITQQMLCEQRNKYKVQEWTSDKFDMEMQHALSSQVADAGTLILSVTSCVNVVQWTVNSTWHAELAWTLC